MRRMTFILLLIMFLIKACTEKPAPLPSPTVLPVPYPNTSFADPKTTLGEIGPLVYGPITVHRSLTPWTEFKQRMIKGTLSKEQTLR